MGDLPAFAQNGACFSAEQSADKWRTVAYEAEGVRGTLICAGEDDRPADVTLDPRAEGFYRVYLGLICLGGNTSVRVGLASSRGRTCFRALGGGGWSSVEKIEEYALGTFDLTGEKIVVGKPAAKGVRSALAYIRLVPAERPTAFPAIFAYHMDTDYFADDEYPLPEDYALRMRLLAGRGADLFLHETSAGADVVRMRERAAVGERVRAMADYLERKDRADRALADCAHGAGARVYAACRMQAGNFVFPFDEAREMFYRPFFDEHAEFSCLTRDGRRMGMLSYAFPEVRAEMIKSLVAEAKCGFDGVSLIFIRGTHTAFEQPVLDAVRARYGADARRLPLGDERLSAAYCEFMTAFMRELRAALDGIPGRRKEVNAVVFTTAKNSLAAGLDVGAWAREGLIDSVAQGLMMHGEDVDGCLSSDGLIDVEKYAEACLSRPVFVRRFDVNAAFLSEIEEGAREYMRMCAPYTDVYGTLCWERASEESVFAAAAALRRAGVKKFISWNANHKAKHLGVLNAELCAAAGREEEYAEYARLRRVYSLGGCDMTAANPNWKG